MSDQSIEQEIKITRIGLVIDKHDEYTTISILRNPHGFTQDEVRAARLNGADLIERYRDAYRKMRKFAEDSGLDTAAYVGGTPAGAPVADQL